MESPSCGLHVYARISPAIITPVREGDRALRASNARFPGAFFGTLAGFADVGESLEDTLVPRGARRGRHHGEGRPSSGARRGRSRAR